MRKISILSTFFLAIGLMLSIASSETKAQSPVQKEQVPKAKSKTQPHYIETKDRIEVAFTENLCFGHLVYLKEELEKRKITINYKLLEFDENDKLQSISCEIDCNDGYKGAFSINYTYQSNKGKRNGFYRDYSDNAKSPFGTGHLGEYKEPL